MANKLSVLNQLDSFRKQSTTQATSSVNATNSDKPAVSVMEQLNRKTQTVPAQETVTLFGNLVLKVPK